jgi:TPR repeat protein
VAARPAPAQPPPDAAAAWARAADALLLFGYLPDRSATANSAPARAAIRRYQLHAGEQQTGALTDPQREQLLTIAQNLRALLDAPRVSPAGVAADTLTGPDARYQRAAQHETGQGAARNDGEAIYWLRLAAAEGSREALNNLGLRYSRGQGVARDLPNALALWRAAAVRGEPNAAFNLGMAHERGVGVATDAAAARRWYLVARNAGSQEARRALERLR